MSTSPKSDRRPFPILWVLVALALMTMLCSCEVLTSVGEAVGIITPRSDGALVTAAKHVDAALGGWFWTLIGLGGTAGAVQVHPKGRRATAIVARSVARAVLLRRKQHGDSPHPGS